MKIPQPLHRRNSWKKKISTRQRELPRAAETKPTPPTREKLPSKNQTTAELRTVPSNFFPPRD